MSFKSINSIASSFSSKEESYSEIPLKEQFFMGDFEKYYKYGKIPYLFFFHMILLILSTLIVIIYKINNYIDLRQLRRSGIFSVSYKKSGVYVYSSCTIKYFYLFIFRHRSQFMTENKFIS